MSTAHGHTAIPAFTVADRLRKAREFVGLDQAELAADIDVSRATIGNYETGRVKPRVIVMKAWALRTGVPLGWLQTGAAASPHPPEGDGGLTARARPDLNWEPSDP